MRAKITEAVRQVMPQLSHDDAELVADEILHLLGFGDVDVARLQSVVKTMSSLSGAAEHWERAPYVEVHGWAQEMARRIAALIPPSPASLVHAVEDCPGEWRLQGKRGTGTWKCDHCDAEHPANRRNSRAADREYALGALMRNQARRHRLRHIFERKPDPPPIIELPKPEDPKEPWQE